MRLRPPTAHLSFLQAVIILTLIVVASSAKLKSSETHISTTRNAYRQSICGFYSGTYDSSEIEATKKYIKQYSYLSESEIQSILFSQNLASTSTNTIILAAPHVIAFAVCIILWIPLCCCCVWPQKHPACQKCRKPQKQNYGGCELKWTAYMAIICYLAVAGAGIIAIVQGSNIILYFNDIGCKITAIGDDFVNGRLSPTVENRFFTGLSPFSTDLTSFKTNFNTIWTQSQNALNLASNLRVKQTFYKTQMNSTYTAYSNSVYNQAFAINGTTYQDITSAFKTMHYGPTQNSSTILGKMYSTSSIIFNQINKALDSMIAAWGNLSTTTQATVNTQMTSTLTSSASLQTNINDFQSKLGKFFSNQSIYANLVLMLKAFYGAFFGLAFFGAVAAVLLACFSVVRIRLIIYFTCGIMYFLSVIAFILLIVLSILGPTLSQVCAYMDTKLATGAGTNDFFSKMGWSQMGSLTKNCMSDGTGWMMNQLSPTFNITFADIITITNGVQTFGDSIPNYSTANFTGPITTGAATVTKVRNAQLLQIDNTAALSFIDGVRLVTYPRLNCTNPAAVLADSWMPSYTLYSCPSGKSQNTPCSNLANTVTCPFGCYEIMNQLQSAAGDTSYVTSLQSRYSLNCNYYTFIVGLQTKWNVVRRNKMDTVLGELTTLNNDVTNYDNYFKNVQANVTTFSTILQTNFDGTTNVTAGTWNGMDCRVIGQSIIDFRNAVCVGFLGSVYYNFIVLIVISYGTLLVACFGTCASVRHFKHLQRMKINIGYKGVPVAISEQRIFDSEKS